jgi:hypothetical protein
LEGDNVPQIKLKRIRLEIDSSTGFCEQGNKPLGVTKGWEFLGMLSNCQFYQEELRCMKLFSHAIGMSEMSTFSRIFKKDDWVRHGTQAPSRGKTSTS